MVKMTTDTKGKLIIAGVLISALGSFAVPLAMGMKYKARDEAVRATLTALVDDVIARATV